MDEVRMARAVRRDDERSHGAITLCTGKSLCALCAVFAPLVIWTVLLTVPSLPLAVRDQLPSYARNLGSGLFLTAGVLRMATWRMAGDWAVARSALILLTLGTALPSASVLKLFVHDGSVVEQEAPVTRLLLVVPVLLLAIGSRHDRRTRRLTAATFAVFALAVPTVISAVADAPPEGQRHVLLWTGLETLVASGWATLALQTWLGRDEASGPSARNTSRAPALGMVVMAAGEVLKAWSVADAGAPHGLSAGFQLVAAGVAAVTAARGMWAAFHARSHDAEVASKALFETRGRLAEIERAQRERLHDARSAVLGVVGAARLLDGPQSSIDPATLRHMMTDELVRLHHLLEAEAEPMSAFSPAEALRAVVLAHRVNGMDIATSWEAGPAFGLPRATATVLDNLLNNAHKHAPRARVSIACRPAGADIEITVTDDGPGIPACEQVTVLMPGVRGRDARGAGTGLGLYSAARMMSAQGGSLRLESGRPGGTRVTLRLPAAVAVTPHALAG
jgi:signal transduction histidine kinase